MATTRLPEDRPAALRLRGLRTGTRLWRLDATLPADWAWSGFPEPRHRFDPPSGRFRTRYVATSLQGAARERYVDAGRYIEAGHASLHVVELLCTRPLRCLDLRNEAMLDALGLDDRASTSHEPEIWTACHQLADLVRGWWKRIDGIVYRSRTTPQTSSNIAIWSIDGLTPTSRLLAACVDELDDLVVNHGFTVDFDY